MAQSGGAPPPFVPRPSSAQASSLSSRPRLGTPPLPRAGFATVPRQSGRFWTPPARSPRPTEVPSSRVGLDSPRPSPCGVAASTRPGNRNGTDDKKNFHAKTIIGHVACLSAHSAGSRGAGDMTLATSAARSARRAMLTLVPRCPSSGPTARDALTASNAFPRSCASSSSSRPWSVLTRGVSTRVVSCGNGDFGRLGHGGDGRGNAGLGMSAETFQPMTGIPQVRHRDLIHPSRRHLIT